MLANAVDKTLDWTVVLGYSRVGLALRRRLWDSDRADPDLTGTSVLVTGASSGIGEAACLRFAAAGATVHLLARDRKRGEAAMERIAERTGSDRLHLELCDVSSLGSVRELSERFAATHAELHVLVNNAGAMPASRTITDEGLELTFATNVAGPFLLTGLLLPLLAAGAPARVINVSSGGMYTQRLDVDDLQLAGREYDPPAFYAHTKRCEVVLTEIWAERMRASGISFHSMHPGWADTPGVRTSLPRFRKVMGPVLRDADEGADTIVWLAGASEPASLPGRFWHDRAPRPTHRVPWTRESADERERLWRELERLTGWSLAEGDAVSPAGSSSQANEKVD